jgi:hypothetical protein
LCGTFLQESKSRDKKSSKKHSKAKKSKKKRTSSKSETETSSDASSTSSSSSDGESSNDGEDGEEVRRSVITGKRIKMFRESTTEDKMLEIERAAKRHYMNSQY